MRNSTLDVLRALAIILVFSYHSEGALLVSRFGWLGVDLFFVLSGYLVSGLLFREYQTTQRVKVGRFLLRRGFKIYPQFYFFIALSSIIGLIRGHAPSLPKLGAELAFVQNYTPGLWTHTWSLGVEEHFYLLLAFAIAMLARRGGINPFETLPKWIMYTCGAILGLRVLTWVIHQQVTGQLLVFPSHLRMDSFLGGVLVSYYDNFRGAGFAVRMRRAAGWLPPISILLLSPVAFLTREDPFIVTAGFSMVSWGFTLLLLSVLYPVKPRRGLGKGARALAALGRVSYAFYLWPVLVASDWLRPRAAQQGIGIPLAVNFVLTFGISALLAFLTTRLLEQPFLRLRDRLIPSRVRSPLADTRAVQVVA